ncbi:MAG: ABC transporter permease [Candidatus Methanomethylophilaceae archaeon]
MNAVPRTVIVVSMAAMVVFPILLLLGWATAESWRYPDLIPSSMDPGAIIDYLSGSRVVKAVCNSIELSLIVTVGSLVLGYMPAKVLGTMDFRGKGLLRVLVLLPALTPGICVVFGMIPVFIDLGIYRSYISIVLGQITFCLPYMILTLSSVFENFDGNYEMQSASLGVDKLTTLVHVTLPRIRSGLAVGCMYTFMVSWSMYLLTYELSPTTLETVITMIMPMLTSSTATYYTLALTAVAFFLPSLVFLVLSSFVIRSDGVDSGGST